MSRFRVFILSSFVSLAVGCAPKEKEHEKVFAVADDFIGYVQSFEADAQTRGSVLSINDLIVDFGSTPNLNETGVCIIADNETPRIVINRSIWNTLNYDDREEVMYHELGHCVLRRAHQSGEVMGYNGMFQIPDSVMYPYRIPGHVYRSNDTYYLGELFTSAKFNQF